MLLLMTLYFPNGLSNSAKDSGPYASPAFWQKSVWSLERSWVDGAEEFFCELANIFDVKDNNFRLSCLLENSKQIFSGITIFVLRHFL